MSGLVSDPIVLMGPPRSGTTYLARIFDEHPQVVMSNELRVFEWLKRAFVDLPENAQSLLMGGEEFVAHLRTALPELVRDYYRSRAPSARWWGDKNPHYAQHGVTLATIRELFPGARFVFIFRDPRAVIASLFRKRNRDGSPWVELDAAHAMVVEHLECAVGFRESLPDGVFHHVRYEDLVTDDVSVARSLFDALGVSFAPEVERFCRSQGDTRTPLSGPTTSAIGSPDRDAARKAWREAVPVPDRVRSLDFLAPWLLQLGYEDERSLADERRSANARGD